MSDFYEKFIYDKFGFGSFIGPGWFYNIIFFLLIFMCVFMLILC